MGTYTELTVAGYPLITSKSAVVPEVMTVFRESDPIVKYILDEDYEHPFGYLGGDVRLLVRLACGLVGGRDARRPRHHRACRRRVLRS